MFKNQIEAGVAVLDKKLPEWEKKIDLERLNLGDVCDCVIGQLHPDESYISTVYDLIGIESISDSTTDEYGFSTPDYRDYPSLTREWKELILERRNQHVSI